MAHKNLIDISNYLIISADIPLVPGHPRYPAHW